MFYSGHNMLGGPSMPVLESDLLAGVVAAVADVSIVLDQDHVVQGFSTRSEGAALEGLAASLHRPISGFLTPDSYEKLRKRLSAFQGAGYESRQVWCELIHLLDEGETAPVRYSLHALPDGLRFLMLGTDQRPVVELQQQLITAQIAMERDYESRREVDTRFRMVMEVSRDPVLFVSVATRRIVDINAAAADLLGAGRQELTGVDFGQQFEGITSAELMERALAAATDARPQAVIVQSRRSQKRLELHGKLFRAAGERLLILRIETSSVGSAAAADPLDENLRQLYAKGVDGMVFTDREGVILSASESFLNLTDAPTLSSVKGRSLADFLVRGGIDLKVMLENARRAGHVRVYPTRLKTDFNGQLPVEISATWISEGAQPVLALIVRDAGRIEALRGAVAPTDAGVTNVMELVGSTPLKDIVAETTNIVEKMCIENAVELTRNNRVAAAEMLGLSRQSLYVKLRKYGLISRDSEGGDDLG